MPFSINFMEAYKTYISITLMSGVFYYHFAFLPLLITGEVPLKIPNYQTMGEGKRRRPYPSTRQGNLADPPSIAPL